MATSGGPKTEKEGLIFGFDNGYKVADTSTSTRFFKGKTTTNLYDSIDNTQTLRSPRTSHFWNGKKWIVNSSYTHPGVPGPKGVYLGKVFKFTSGALSSTWSGNSYGYMLRDISTTNGITHTQSAGIYASEDCDLTSIPSTIEQESSGESTVSGHPASYDLTNKGTWQRIAKKAVADDQVRFITLYPRKHGVTDGSFSGFFMWAAPQVIEGAVPTPYLETGTSRSATEGLIDLKKSTNIDVSNISFDTTGLPTFDGTDDYIDLPNDLGYSNAVSVFAIFKSNGTPTGGYHIICGGQELEISVPTAGQLRTGVYTTARYVNNLGSGLSDGNYHYIGFTYSGNTKTAYIDGISVGTQSTSGTLTNSFSNRRIGRFGSSSTYYINGELPVYTVFNRALTAEEVKENFNAYRKRFDI